MRRTVLVSIVLSMLLTSSAWAHVIEVNQELEGTDAVAQISISGESDKNYIPLSVAYPDADTGLVNPNVAGSVQDTYQMIKNIPVKEDESFGFTFTIKNGGGTYKVRLDGEDTTFSLMSSEELITFRTDINADVDGKALAMIFEDQDENLFLKDLTACEFDREDLGVALKKNAPYIKINDALQDYRRNAAALILSEIKNKDKFLNIATTYETVLMLDSLDAYEIYADFNKNEKQSFYENISKKPIDSYEAFAENFSEQVVLTELSFTKNYGDAITLLDTNADILGIDWERELKGIKQTSSVYKGLFGNYYESSEALETRVEQLVAAQKKKENTANSSTSSGGGGGGGGVGIGSGTSFADGRMPSSTGITVAQKKPATEENVLFTDLEDAAWAKDKIYALAERKAISGMGDGRFAPNAEVTREQFVRALVVAFDITGAEDPEFEDVDKLQWYYDAICVAYKNQIVMGINENNFGIGRTLTREEMATLVFRAMKHCGYSFESELDAVFTDANEISTYAARAVKAMSAEQLINGFPDGSFQPKGNCTRAQMAVMIAQACEKLSK